MNPFNDFDFEEIFEDTSEAEQVIAQAQAELSSLLKDSIKNTLTEAAQARKELDALNWQIAEAKRGVQKWQREAEKAEEEFEKARDFDIPQKYITRIVHNLTGDFAPGDKAYVIQTNESRTKCPRCEGKKRIEVQFGTETMSVKCPDCDGAGEIYVKEPSRIEEKTVTMVYLKLCFDKNGVGLWNRDNIFLNNSDWATPVKDIYHSPEEARTALKGE